MLGVLCQSACPLRAHIRPHCQSFRSSTGLHTRLVAARVSRDASDSEGQIQCLEHVLGACLSLSSWVQHLLAVRAFHAQGIGRQKPQLESRAQSSLSTLQFNSAVSMPPGKRARGARPAAAAAEAADDAPASRTSFMDLPPVIAERIVEAAVPQLDALHIVTHVM